MSYKLCCGSFKHSDLSLAVGKVETEVTCASSSIEEKTSSSNSPIDVHNCDKITGASNIDSADHEGDFIISKERKVKSKTLVPKKKVDVKYKNTKKNGKFWSFRFKRQNKKVIHESLKDKAVPEQDNSCMCTGFKKTKDHAMGPGILFTAETLLNKRSAATASPLTSANRVRLSMGAGPGGPGPSGMGPLPVDLFQLVPAPPQRPSEALIDLSRFNPDDYPTEDVDEIRIAQRAREIEMGLEISPRHVAYPNVLYGGGSPPSTPSTSTLSSSRSSLNTDPMWNLNANFPSQCVVTTINYPQLVHPQPLEAFSRQALQASASNVAPIASASEVVGAESASIYGTVTNLSMPIATPSPYIPQTVHTQVDYMHCLVPDLKNIANCGFYWGVMDRYEAERLLENRPEGTFLLRDSAQEEFLFSVSFRRYGRSLHARIEQWNHKFSFDSHDPGVYAADTVAGLIEHYKDPSSCMFFEPMLTVPLNRTFPFSLQHLCRSVICSNNVYDGIDYLPLPKSMRDYLKYYHYKQKVRVRRFEMHH